MLDASLRPGDNVPLPPLCCFTGCFGRVGATGAGAGAGAAAAGAGVGVASSAGLPPLFPMLSCGPVSSGRVFACTPRLCVTHTHVCARLLLAHHTPRCTAGAEHLAPTARPVRGSRGRFHACRRKWALERPATCTRGTRAGAGFGGCDLACCPRHLAAWAATDLRLGVRYPTSTGWLVQHLLPRRFGEPTCA